MNDGTILAPKPVTDYKKFVYENWYFKNWDTNWYAFLSCLYSPKAAQI